MLFNKLFLSFIHEKLIAKNNLLSSKKNITSLLGVGMVNSQTPNDASIFFT